MSRNDQNRKRPQVSATKRMMDYIALRDHSEKELRTKLKKRFEPEEIDKAIDYGKTHGWIPDTAEGLEALSKKTASYLSRKGKGVRFINHNLHKKGLPSVKMNPEEELEKALMLVQTKFASTVANTREEKEKLKAKKGRFLISRGFDMDVVRKVVYNE